MTLQELIKKMKDSRIIYYSLFEAWLNFYCYKLENNESVHDVYGKIAAFILGLSCTGFITNEEKDCLIDELFIYRGKSE